jgi:putative spermidine/putrescine transport system permease protein
MKKRNQAYMTFRPLGDRLPSYFLYVFCALVFFYLIMPIFIVIPMSFSSSMFLKFPPPGFSLQWYKNYLTSRDWMEATWVSIRVALATTLLATFLGTLLAFALVRGRFRAKSLIYSFAVSPMIVPLIIVAIAVYFFYAKIHLVGTLSGMIAAHTLLATPFVLVIVTSTLKGFDETLERASLSLGANPLKTFLLVTLPIIRPGSFGPFRVYHLFDELVVAIFVADPRRHLAKGCGMGSAWRSTLRSPLFSIFIGLSVLLIAIELIRRRTKT